MNSGDRSHEQRMTARTMFSHKSYTPRPHIPDAIIRMQCTCRFTRRHFKP